MPVGLLRGRSCGLRGLERRLLLASSNHEDRNEGSQPTKESPEASHRLIEIEQEYAAQYNGHRDYKCEGRGQRLKADVVTYDTALKLLAVYRLVLRHSEDSLRSIR
jgi:hypothetical protein